MNAVELFLKDGRQSTVFYCGQCRIVHRDEAAANQCCAPYKCDMCGTETSRYWTRCDMCRAKVEAEKEQERFEKAEKLTDWDGWVYLEGTGRDGFSDSLSDFCDNWSDDHDGGGELPKYVWACKANHFVQADMGDIFSAFEGDAYEDFDPETLDGLDDLKAALEKFNQANSAVCSYHPDYTKAVLLNHKPTP